MTLSSPKSWLAHTENSTTYRNHITWKPKCATVPVHWLTGDLWRELSTEQQWGQKKKIEELVKMCPHLNLLSSLFQQRRREKERKGSFPLWWTAGLFFCVCVHFSISYLTSDSRSAQLPVESTQTKCWRLCRISQNFLFLLSFLSCYFKTQNFSFLCSVLLLFLQLSPSLSLYRPSVRASFLIGTEHPGSGAVVGCCGILLKWPGVVTLPDVCPAAGQHGTALRWSCVQSRRCRPQQILLSPGLMLGFLCGTGRSQVTSQRLDTEARRYFKV